MNAQDLYDLVVEADGSASDNDLEHVAFVLEGFPNIEWLRQLIREDAPRLAPLMEPAAQPLTTTFAILRGSEYIEREDYTGRLAHLICRQRSTIESLIACGCDPSRIQRKQPKLVAVVDTTQDSIAQRLYDLITAADVVETDDHLAALARDLDHFRVDVFDCQTLVQDAPRLRKELEKAAPSEEYVRQYGPLIRTGSSEFHSGLNMLDFQNHFGPGVVTSICNLLTELFAQHGLNKDTPWQQLEAARNAGLTPNKLEVERRGPRQSYACVYVWMIENNHRDYSSVGLATPLVQSAKNWDKELVEKLVQPCVRDAKESLLKLIVCVANSREQAKELAEEHNRGWREFSRGHLAEQMDTRDARHVILLEKDERPRAVFVWGSQGGWYPPNRFSDSVLW